MNSQERAKALQAGDITIEEFKKQSADKPVVSGVQSKVVDNQKSAIVETKELADARRRSNYGNTNTTVNNNTTSQQNLSGNTSRGNDIRAFQAQYRLDHNGADAPDDIIQQRFAEHKETTPAEMTQIESLQKSNSELQSQVEAANTAAEEVAQNTSAKMANFEATMKEGWNNLQATLGDRFSTIQDIIKGVQDQSKRGVFIDDDFVQKAKYIADGTKTDEDFRKGISQLAKSNLQFLEDQANLSNEVVTENTGKGDYASSGDMGTGQMDNQINVPENANMTSYNSVLEDFNLNRASGDTLNLLNDPNATSEEILASVLNQNIGVLNNNQVRLLEFLENQAEKTRDYTKLYSDMLNKHKEEYGTLIEDQKNYVDKTFELEKSKIEAEKISTMEGLQDKRSRLEGFMKSKLKKEGLLSSTIGINQYVTSITKYDAMITKTDQDFDNTIRDYDLKRTKITMDLTKDLVEVSQKYEKDIFDFQMKQENKIDEQTISALESANERDLKEMDLVATFASDIIDKRAARDKEMRDMVAKAQENMLKEAENMTKSMGLIHSVKNGEIVMLMDTEGNPIPTWEREKAYMTDQTKREIHNSTQQFNREKEAFDQWQVKATMAINQQKANGTISNNQAKMALAELKEKRLQMEQGLEVKTKLNAESSKVGWDYNVEEGFSFGEPQDRINGIWNFGKECAGWVNDVLGKTVYGTTKESKMSQIVMDNSGMPSPGMTFVQDSGTYGHVGLINSVGTKNGKSGIFITDVNSDGKHKGLSSDSLFRVNHFVPFDSAEYKAIKGFGLGLLGNEAAEKVKTATGTSKEVNNDDTTVEDEISALEKELNAI